VIDKKQQRDDILECLTVAAEVAKLTVPEWELRQLAGRLVEFHGKRLFDLITALPGERNFPSALEIERRVREAHGKPAPKGLSATRIDQNERELVVAGQSPAKAAAGAALMRSTLRMTEKEKETATVLSPGGAIVRVATERELVVATNNALREGFDRMATAEIAVDFEDHKPVKMIGLAEWALGDFDEDEDPKKFDTTLDLGEF
jgi:hypothetical protein